MEYAETENLSLAIADARGGGIMAEERDGGIYAQREQRMQRIRQWHQSVRVKKAVAALEDHGFQALLVENRAQAREELLKRIPPTARVGIGGSMSIREIGIIEDLERQENVIYNHWKPGLTPEQILEIRRAHLQCDIFLTSTNALTLEGELISTDGIGNRIGAMTFGPRQVIVVAGINKIVKDIHSGLQRIKEVATPQTVKEAELAIPCVQTGFCLDCNSPQRACRATIILERRPLLTEILVMIVGEELGF